MKSLSVLLTFLLFTLTIKAQEKPLVDQIPITFRKGGRVFTFTNKAFSQYHGETSKYTNDGWHGWICREQKLFMDYTILVNEKPLDRSKAEIYVYPYMLRRTYPQGIIEELILPDRVDELILHIKGLKVFNIDLTNFNGQILNTSDSAVFFSLNKVLPDYFLTATSSARMRWFRTINDKGLIGVSSDKDDIWLLFRVDKGMGRPAEIESYCETCLKAKKDRIERQLQKCRLRTNSPEFDKAYLWAVASLDALVTKQDVKGIFAGLPWFNNNWGRDTFISLPGACLVNGDFSDAKEILTAFAQFQNTDESSKFYGRIPNRVTLQDIIYNTTDGTPWFVIQAYEYWKYTGDTEFLRSILPVLERAYNGAVKNYVDKQGFLTHADAETWMDAVGADGPWSPRGNRAVDIQYLWYRQCGITSEIAALCGNAKLAKSSSQSAAKVKKNFAKYFVDSKNSLIADRIKANGEKDFSFRPNAFYALGDTDLVPSIDVRTKVFLKLFENTVTKYGVLSLSHTDKNFHPYHEYPPYYPKDAAYHNGIIWQWNTGPVVDLLCDAGKQDIAWDLTKELSRQILNEWAAGSIPELMEAMPRENSKEIKMSGTFSQAWSLAEYIRTIREKYIGITPLPNNKIKIQPARPNAFSKLEFPLFYKSSLLRCSIRNDDDAAEFQVIPITVNDTFELELKMPDGPVGKYLQSAKITPGMNKAINWSFSYKSSNLFLKPRKPLFISEQLNQLKFCEVKLAKDLPALKAPEYLMLLHEEIKRNPGSAGVLLSASTPVNDELYQYPTNPNFVKGILDLKKFTLRSDKENYYFELTFSELNDPKWHAEYGFQLTFAGLYFHFNDSGSTDAGRNSSFVFQPDRAWQKAVFVGGGIEVVDHNGKLLAKYAPKPGDVINPLGNVNFRKISFALPKSLLGEIKMSTRVSILVGAQDDHGGSGVGEFRQVQERAGEWYGGGKRNKSAHNVYDFLFIN